LVPRKSEGLRLVKKILGPRHRICGGANAPVTVGIGTEEEIDAAVRPAIKTLGPTRFILNASIYICDNDVTWDRFLTFVDAWRRYA
jgi:hypothetical protein